ncbi:MAG: ribosomal protein S19 family protein [Parasporobacterium sp.]|nr:ribosomal protein S19 family protein [Parasporobacterium sp.]
MVILFIKWVVKTWSCHSTISPVMIVLTITVHDGCRPQKCQVLADRQQKCRVPAARVGKFLIN